MLNFHFNSYISTMIIAAQICTIQIATKYIKWKKTALVSNKSYHICICARVFDAEYKLWQTNQQHYDSFITFEYYNEHNVVVTVECLMLIQKCGVIETITTSCLFIYLFVIY